MDIFYISIGTIQQDMMVSYLCLLVIIQNYKCVVKKQVYMVHGKPFYQVIIILIMFLKRTVQEQVAHGVLTLQVMLLLQRRLLLLILLLKPLRIQMAIQLILLI